MMNTNPRLIASVLLLLAFLTPVPPAFAQEGGSNVALTKHNLTAAGPGEVRVGGTKDVCAYCHTPHAANPIAPLWNRSDQGTYYDTYDSTTLVATVGQPTGSSRLCLSCHDGTIAMNQTYNPSNATGTSIFISPTDSGYLGTDLTDDHPISFPYDAALATQHPELHSPDNLPAALPLDSQGQLQCTTCHNPHNDNFGQFLRMDNTASAMCRSCHDIGAWQKSPHAVSTAALANATREDWANLEAITVADAACESCHRPHSGGSAQWLLRREAEEDTCYSCHDGSVAQTDILAETSKMSAHPLGDFTGLHNPREEAANMPEHVECSDCHDPHTNFQAGPAGAPFIQAPMAGVSGVSSSGSAVAQATYEYEVCYKCHAGDNAVGASPVDRIWANADLSDKFSPGNASYHPVEAQGKNLNVPSLLQPLNTTSLIYCSDCHGSDSDTAQAGPHGSIHTPLLKRPYSTLDDTIESPSAYELCYECHNRRSILDDESFDKHKKHIVDERTSCSVCHDPHGVSAGQASAANSAHLINFDRNVVFEADSGDGPFFEDLPGIFQGTCTLSCHGENHENEHYGGPDND